MTLSRAVLAMVGPATMLASSAAAQTPGHGQPPARDLPGPQATLPGAPPGYVAAPLGSTVSDDEESDIIPPGYHTETRVRKDLMTVGAGTLGVGYLMTIIVAGVFQISSDVNGEHRNFGPLLVPVVGPFVGVATTRPATDGVLGLVALGVVQTCGLGMLIGGIAAPRTVLRRNGVAGVTFTVTPRLDASTAGIGAVGSF